MSQNLEKGKYRDFYYRQLDYLAKKDIEGLIHNHYAPDAELLSFDVYVKGTDALIKHFINYVGGLGYIKLLSTEKYVEGDDSILFEATVETAGGIARVYDIFAFRDGKIWRHFSGLLGFTPNS